MRTIELKLQEVWGVNAPAFCKECGVPAVLSRCGHDAAPWSELSPRQRACAPAGDKESESGSLDSDGVHRGVLTAAPGERLPSPV